jgi:hypothetical protein
VNVHVSSTILNVSLWEWNWDCFFDAVGDGANDSKVATFQFSIIFGFLKIHLILRAFS